MWGRLVREGKSGLGQVLPLTLGSDISGTVAALGVGVGVFALDDAVYGATNDQFVGGYAEYALVEAGKVAPDEAYVRSKGVRAAYFIVDVTRPARVDPGDGRTRNPRPADRRGPRPCQREHRPPQARWRAA